MDSKYSTITFCRNDYKQYYDYIKKDDYNYDEMYDDIKSFIRVAIKNGYQMRIWFDGETVVVEYNYSDEGMSGVSLEWLGEDEYVGQCSKEDNT